MRFYENFIKLLFTEYNLIQAKETGVLFEASFSASGYNSNIPIEEMSTSLDFLQERDRLHLSVSFGDSEPIILSSEKRNLETFKEKLDAEAIHLSGELISISFNITKTVFDSECTIYELDTFTETIDKLTCSQFLTIFSGLLNSTSIIKFKVLNYNSSFYSSSISFSSINSNINLEIPDKRNQKFDGFKSLCHYSEIDNHKLLPSDFKLIKSDDNQAELNRIFNNYSIVFSIIYLFDITSLNDNQLEFKINGYKTINGKVDLSKLNINALVEYYDIFDWVYNGGNLNDKIGLARNIITLHFANIGDLDLNGHPFQSVKSSYKVYEKQNIKQYIEIRNKISDQLIDFNNRANKIVETFASGFQKSALALISFYISAVVIRVLSKGEFLNIFSLDATILSIVFVLGSLIYFGVSRWELKEQKERFVNSYNNLKLRYTDLLEEDDIKRILNDDKEFKEDVSFIDKKRKVYSRMWIAFLFLLAGSTILLFLIYNLSQLSDTLIFKVFFRKAC